MSYLEHLKLCGYCQKHDRATKLAELGHMIRGTSKSTGTRGASSKVVKPGYAEKLRAR